MCVTAIVTVTATGSIVQVTGTRRATLSGNASASTIATDGIEIAPLGTATGCGNVRENASERRICEIANALEIETAGAMFVIEIATATTESAAVEALKPAEMPPRCARLARAVAEVGRALRLGRVAIVSNSNSNSFATATRQPPRPPLPDPLLASAVALTRSAFAAGPSNNASEPWLTASVARLPLHPGSRRPVVALRKRIPQQVGRRTIRPSASKWTATTLLPPVQQLLRFPAGRDLTGGSSRRLATRLAGVMDPLAVKDGTSVVIVPLAVPGTNNVSSHSPPKSQSSSPTSSSSFSSAQQTHFMKVAQCPAKCVLEAKNGIHTRPCLVKASLYTPV